MKMEKSCELSVANVNQKLLNINYAVRGPVHDRAEQIERELERGVRKPFSRVVRANFGDSIALGQPPVTFVRQVLAAVSYPALLQSPDLPQDVKDRARLLLDDCPQQSAAAASPAAGLAAVRRQAAEYLARRDGAPASSDHVYLGSGASDLIHSLLELFAQDVDGKPPSVMVPCPQYPLFSSVLSELGVRQASYSLAAGAGWALRARELERCLAAARRGGSVVRAVVVINPGNPTGQVLSREDIEDIIKFSHRHGLFILADEVYQDNVVEKPFISFKKVMCSLGKPYSELGLASVLSASKGWAGECGARAGCVELHGVQARHGVLAAWRALRAVRQCPAVLGQCALHCILKPPAPGEPSHEQFAREVASIRRLLRARAAAAHAHFNSIPGYSCGVIDGGMFAFPRVSIPARAAAAAAARDVTPDTLYALRLLEATGICVVPGSGFGQEEGTFHYRITILHRDDEFQYMMESIRRFHLDFLKTYADE